MSRAREIDIAAFKLDGATNRPTPPEVARSRAQAALSDLEEAIELLSDWIDTYGSKTWEEKYGDRFS